MRIALISDIHAHLFALDAVLADIELRNAAMIICLGDMATIGPHPREVLDRLCQSGCRCIRGNHDAVMLEPAMADKLHVPAQLLPSLHWSISRLAKTQIDFIGRSEASISLHLTDQTLFCYHGSPRNITDIIGPATPDGSLRAMVSGRTENILAGGHTHVQMQRECDGKTLVNPGSVGSAFRIPPGTLADVVLQPWAEYCIVDTRNAIPAVEMYKIAFDVQGFHQSIIGSDMPLREWWLAQYRQKTDAVAYRGGSGAA